MKRLAIALTLALALAVIASGQDAASERKKLEGAWLPTKAELGGAPLPEELVRTIKLVIEGDMYTVTVGEKVDKGATKVDPSKKPKTMDIIGVEGPNKGKTFLAIYEIKDDTLRICYDLTGKDRPTEFKTKEGALHFLATYKREKK